ncbi:PadR family transcriptional regulator [Novacetimonas pomaceti]|uniref:PadR family transcriptional regulator n=1 Tax=Novacetimonas pomaceti TaxID=2021998 RepID=A0ABX5P8F3_9PROT|nr:PadR family transcriptional regulator [Novacetimonas pomaceti]PYD48178.1 PadR family transcriptional regulator [Novacetimonas pomaceti]
MEPNLVQFKKGVLELCVLALLSQADSYGYDIASRLSEAIEMGEGTIYPLMRRMQKDGLVSTYFVESSSGPPRKYYALTEKGHDSLRAQRTAWTTFTRAVSAILDAPPASGTTTEPSSSSPADTSGATSLTVQKNTGNIRP